MLASKSKADLAGRDSAGGDSGGGAGSDCVRQGGKSFDDGGRHQGERGLRR